MTRGRAGHPVAKIMSPEVGKWVTVNVNGNIHHEARILISPYTMRQFENLLSHLTDKLKPPFGAVWRLFTEQGTEVKDLDDIKGGHTYIASGRARPTFPARLAAKSASGRGGRDARTGEQRGLRSHSAAGSLGGADEAVASFGGARVADAASDTNVKQGHEAGGPAGRQPRPGPAPRRGKANSASSASSRAQPGMWDGPDGPDGPLHSQTQPPKGSKEAQACRARRCEHLGSDDAMGAMGSMEGASVQRALRKAR